MTAPINIKAILELVRQQEPNRQDIIIALTNSFDEHWESKVSFRLVDSIHANEKGAEWQFD